MPFQFTKIISDIMVTVDIGTGEGEWASKIAVEYDYAEVKGYDLIQDRFDELKNRTFYIQDLWDIDLPPGTCDLVHSR